MPLTNAQQEQILIKFNEKPRLGREAIGRMLNTENPSVIDNTLLEILIRNLNNNDILDPARFSVFLLDKSNEALAKRLFASFEWKDKDFLEAVNETFAIFVPPKDGNKFQYLLGLIASEFATQYTGKNPFYKDSDTLEVLAVGIVQINKALHDDSLKPAQKKQMLQYANMYEAAYGNTHNDGYNPQRVKFLIEEADRYREMMKGKEIPVRFNETLPGFTLSGQSKLEETSAFQKLRKLFDNASNMPLNVVFPNISEPEFLGYSVSTKKKSTLGWLFGIEGSIEVKNSKNITVASMQYYKPGLFSWLFGDKPKLSISAENEDHYATASNEQGYLLAKMAASFAGVDARVEGTLNHVKEDLKSKYELAINGTLTLSNEAAPDNVHAATRP